MAASLKWYVLQSLEEMNAIRENSHQKIQLIFKHSTRCSISTMAKSRLERSDASELVDFHFLDLIQFRHISNAIADGFDVEHESPQVLLIHNGTCIYDESHNGITMDEIHEQVSRISSS